MSDTEPEAATVRDPGEYVNQRRLKDIFDARSELREHRLEVQQAAHEDRFAAVSAYRSAVSNYLLEVEPLLQQHEPGPHYLNEYTFGTLRVEPPARTETAPGRTGATRTVIDIQKNTGSSTVAVTDVPDPVIHELHGLTSLFRIPDPVIHEFTFESESRHTRGREYTKTQTVQINFQTLDLMVRTINNFLGEAGLELDTQTDDEWHIEP